MADKSVTPYPLEGWEYAAPDADFEDADGVRFVCGAQSSAAGCGDAFYLNFVRFEEGREIEPPPERRTVMLGVGSRNPWRPHRG